MVITLLWHQLYFVLSTTLEDLALILLREPFHSDGGRVSTIELNGVAENTDMLDKMVIISGWGKTEHTAWQMHLQYTNLRVKNVTEQILVLSQEEGRSVCQGESGGKII